MNFQPVTLTLDFGGVSGMADYTPDTRVGNVFTFASLGATSPSTNRVLSSSITKPTKTAKYYKVRVRLVDNVSKVVVDATGNSNETGILDHTNSMEVVMQWDPKSTDQERRAAYSHMLAALQNEAFSSQACNLRSLY